MNPNRSRLLILATVLGVAMMSGCADTMFSSDSYDESSPGTHSQTDAFRPVLRNAQLLGAAWSKSVPVAGKGEDGSIVQADLFAFIGYSDYQANGITPRILQDYEITQRILEDYGVTRRVLEDYGITQRVLEDYGITQRVLEDYGITQRVLEDYGVIQRLLEDYGITQRVLEDYAIIQRVLEDYGITQRVLADYGITQRVLDEYGVTRRLLADYGLNWGEFAASLAIYDSSIKVRVATDGGISVWIRGRDLESILSEMVGDTKIDFVEPDPETDAGILGYTNTKNSTDGQFYPWGVDRISGGQKLEGDSRKSNVYILDSGVTDVDLNLKTRKDFTMLFLNREQVAHEENDWVNPGFFDPGTDGNPDDENGHGTHVAGTLASLDNKMGVIGTAPGLILHSLKVLTADGRTDVTTLVAAFNYVIHQKQNVHKSDEQVLINLSMGMDIGTTGFNVLDETVQKAIDAGIVVVVSAGNDGADASTYSPAHVPDVITVGAYDNQNEFARFSNFGADLDLLAPGVDIVSLPRTKAEVDDRVRVVRSGTSMAAPHVTAAAAVLWSKRSNRSWSPTEVALELIKESEIEISGTPGATTDRSVSLK